MPARIESEWIKPECFASYPPEGRALAISHLAVLRQMPVALLPVFLRELKNYDWQFPLEQQQVNRRLDFLQANPSSTAGFLRISVPHTMDRPENAANPERFLAEISAYLWSSLQMDAYRESAAEFMHRYLAMNVPAPPALPRLLVILIGRGAASPPAPLFQKLRKYGQIRTNVQTEGASQVIADIIRRRFVRHPAPYAHWYVDGGDALPGMMPTGVTHLSWPSLAAVDRQVLGHILSCIRSGSGPEVLQEQLAVLSTQGLSAGKVAVDSRLADSRLQHFAVSVLTEGSGTQIFSTTFVQRAMREILRRAQPVTVLSRFAPRQRQRPFNAMIEAVVRGSYDLDPDGSLIDADMAAYYGYLDLMELSGSAQSSILIWYEDHPVVFAAGPRIPGNTSTDSPCTIAGTFSDLLADA